MQPDGGGGHPRPGQYGVPLCWDWMGVTAPPVRIGWRYLPGQDWMGVTPSPGLAEQHSEHLLHGGRYVLLAFTQENFLVSLITFALP